MNISPRRDALVFIAVIVAAVLIGYNLVYKYNLNQLNSVKLQIKEEKQKNELLERISKLDRKLIGYQQRSLDSPEITQFLDKLSRLAQEVGIEIESFTPQPAMRRDEYLELPVRLPLNCHYHRLGRFLSLLESNREFIWIKDIRIRKQTVSDPRQTRLPAVDLTVSGLYLKK